MAQITLKLDLAEGISPTKIKNILSNIKGIQKVSTISKTRKKPLVKKKKQDEWITRMEALSKMFDISDVDTKDEKTRYILSK